MISLSWVSGRRQNVLPIAKNCLRSAPSVVLYGSALVLLVSSPLLANPGYQNVKIDVGGKSLLTLRAPTNDMSVQQRADAVQARLVTILADRDLRPSDIVAVPLGRNEAKVMVRNKLLVTATIDSAHLYNMTPMELASHWVRHLRIVLPQVSVKPNPRLRNYAEKIKRRER